MYDDELSVQLRGAAALIDILDLIGEVEANDHDMAKLVCNYELELRALLRLGI